MPTRVDRIVTTAVVDTLENMAFMEVVAADRENQRSGGRETISVRQQVLAPVRGELRLIMPRPLVAMIAETIFTMAAEEISGGQLEDVATELLNTIAGRFLNEFLPADDTYKLGLPVIETTAAAGHAQQTGKWCFLVAEQPVTLTVSENLLGPDRVGFRLP